MGNHRISIAREQYKFSCAHMTVFPDGSKERLHGHNYQIAVVLDVERIDLPSMIPFDRIKDALRELCAEWKEYVLLATENPHFKVLRQDDNEIEFTLCNVRYMLPRTDVKLLPLDNISVEALAAHIAELLVTRLRPSLDPRNVRTLEVTIEEQPGQGASCTLSLG